MYIKGETQMIHNNSSFWNTFYRSRDYEFRSSAEFCGWPLVHISRGIDPKTGQLRVARGFIAIGEIACGVFAFGGIAAGIFALGGISLASFAIGGIALGGKALGGIAVGICTAVGTIAVSPGTALGFLTLKPQLTGLAAKILTLFTK
jgi:hypothetical protein